MAAGAVALLLGIAGAVLGTQCAAGGGQLAICPQASHLALTGDGAEPVPQMVTAAEPAAPAAERAEPSEPAAPPAAPPRSSATLSAHELIEGSHGRLLLAQAERPLFAGSVGTEGDAGDGTGPGAAAAPAQLAYAGPDRAAGPPVRAEFGTAVPPAPPEDGGAASEEAAGTGGPLLPPLPEPEPLSLPTAALKAPPAAGGTRQSEEAEDSGAAPVVTAARIGDSGVNVRAGPSTADARLFGLEPGEQVMATESDDGWLKIEDAAGRVGWVRSDLLAATDGDTAAAPAAGAEAPPAAAAETPPPAAPAAPAADTPEGIKTRTVAGTGVSVREQPSNSGTRLFVLAAGEEVTVTGSDKGWLQVVDSRGRTGWAYSDFFTPGS